MIEETEMLDVVDSNNILIRTISRDEWYGGENEKNTNEFIRYVDIFIFNKEGKLLVPIRSMNKKLSPGCYDYSCGEHVTAGESFDSAAKRGIKEELGLTNTDLQKCRLMRPEEISVKGFSVAYIGIIEDESLIRTNEEVERFEWWDIKDIYDVVLSYPEKFKTSYKKTFEMCLLEK